jgi:hypothetical protein
MDALIAKLRLVLAELAKPGAMRDDWFAWAAVVSLVFGISARVARKGGAQ